MAESQKHDVPQHEKFFRYFQHEVTDLQDQMNRFSNLGAAERADAVDHCLAGIARLSSEVNDASAYIPAYDQRTYGEAVKALSNKLQDVRSTFAPRAKFSFKSGAGSAFTAKKNESAISLNDAEDMANQRRKLVPGYFADGDSGESSFATTLIISSPAPEKASRVAGADGLESLHESDSVAGVTSPAHTSTAVSISSHEGLHIILPSSTNTETSSGKLTNLCRCVVDMSSPTATGKPFAGLTLKNITESLIVCGHVNGAAHLTKIQSSILVVSSRQFRMHESHNCDVYLATSSRPIIEDCTGIRFARLPDEYVTNPDRDTSDQWREVDDFKWLKNEPSPNWSILEDGLPAEVWKDYVPGGPGKSAEDILKAVGIQK
ncbi:TBCC-domain-containing protein [Acrodontium crateriforme]|uniref:TBCC-domain-containing protein n=1 Tax=Acrodontium crateriforme TaxID=150365 RepID=A0AAQ3LZK3_9PEZI|nr:TBCC-domain-containing protein [Acrodontium crateriforme]